MGLMTVWVRRLLVANIVIFFLAQPGSPLFRALSFYPPAVVIRPWTVVTYMFLHGGVGHLVFNMIGLFFFGPRLEERLGSTGFLWLYFLSGIGGAAFQALFATAAPMVGASGAVYGVLLGFALYWPRERIYIWGILPVEAWLLATLLVFGSLYAGVNPGAGSRTAHFAHLGGLAFAFAFIKWWDWKRGSAKRSFQKRMKVDAIPTGVVSDRMALARWKGISTESLHELNREEVERLLAKASSAGASSLTASERQFLDRMAKT
jgi:membrane associated rhomboid family serine protease